MLVGAMKVGRIPAGAAFGDITLLNTSARTHGEGESDLHPVDLDRHTFRVLSKHERKHRRR